MNDEKHKSHHASGDGEPFLPGLGGREPLEFLNKEPADMSERTPREDRADDAARQELPPDEAYEEVTEPYRPIRRRGLAGGGGTNRVMIATGVVVVAAAVFIFWPRGGADLPAPVGEQFSVVAADSGAASTERPAPPRSSDVNLSLEAPPVVPEEPGATTGTGAESAPPSTRQTRRAGVTVSSGEPGADGKWAVQLGSFGTRANAQELAVGLREKGFRVETPTLQSTTGGAQTKVWIAYFETHAAAKAWAAAHADEIGRSTYITHR
ncbi:SPOR domain-containing protein [bacterium]|nr:SPOR domain-containing protein [bacterium]MBU1072221.1 SPOR domain-containing protein [bacterium]MBU1675413.1 SPOR domain-containing protein [bacterium]